MGLLDRFKKKQAAKEPEKTAGNRGPQTGEVSPGGSAIYRYQTPEDQGFRPPADEGGSMEEIEYKLQYGMEGLSQRFAEGKLPLVLDIHRPNLCTDFREVLDGRGPREGEILA